MSQPTPEFSRPVPLARLGPEAFRQEIEATAEEREQLARRFDLFALDRLAGIVTLRRLIGGRIRLEATFEAEFAQICVVTLDPVAGRLAEAFSLLYGPPDDAQAELDLDVDEPVYEPLIGDAIDIGEALAQELSLALPEFPRQPGAVVELPAAPGSEGGALAELTRLRRPLRN
jgi:uncharacterized metal-binding protein YceD (DUF177 family)